MLLMIEFCHLLRFFAAYTAADSRCFSVDRTTSNIAPPVEDVDLQVTHALSDHLSLFPVYSDQHLDRFSGFCRAHERDRKTDRQTDRRAALLRV